jgi:hypothetical protein
MSLHEVSTLIGTTSFSEVAGVPVGSTTGGTTGSSTLGVFGALGVLGSLVFGAAVLGALVAIYTYNYDIFLYSF